VGATKTSYPDSTVMQTDILDNGARPFELFNGINGWSSVITAPASNQSSEFCNNTATTIFNATPTDLVVAITPEEPGIAANGFIAAPGNNGVSSKVGYAAELPPYGYLPIWALTSLGNFTVQVQLFDEAYSGFTPVGSLDVSSGGCTGSAATISSASTADNYQWSVNTLSQSRNNAGGVWGTIYNSTLKP
jgi:hypothetical protein